jgi:mRNA-degrading endonuclease toxin of MazEF toxin-antitoxin module
MTTQSTTTFSRGEVVLVPFQFTDRPVAKNRAAVVISASDYQAGRQELIIAALTSRVREPLLFGDRLLADWRSAGLPKKSVVTAILRTVKQKMVVRRVGNLTDSDLRRLDEGLRTALGLR